MMSFHCHFICVWCQAENSTREYPLLENSYKYKAIKCGTWKEVIKKYDGRRHFAHSLVVVHTGIPSAFTCLVCKFTEIKFKIFFLRCSWMFIELRAKARNSLSLMLYHVSYDGSDVNREVTFHSPMSLLFQSTFLLLWYDDFPLTNRSGIWSLTVVPLLIRWRWVVEV